MNVTGNSGSSHSVLERGVLNGFSIALGSADWLRTRSAVFWVVWAAAFLVAGVELMEIGRSED